VKASASVVKPGVKGVVIGALTPEGHPRYSGTGTYDYSSYHRKQVKFPPLTMYSTVHLTVEPEPLAFLDTIIGLGFDAPALHPDKELAAEEGDSRIRPGWYGQANGRIQNLWR